MSASLLPIHMTASMKRRGFIRLLAQQEMMMMIIRKTPVVSFSLLQNFLKFRNKSE